jgi:hypothetical protein
LNLYIRCKINTLFLPQNFCHKIFATKFLLQIFGHKIFATKFLPQN